jgi:hypothetical protein
MNSILIFCSDLFRDPCRLFLPLPTFQQGLRLEIPPGTHPGLSELIEQCWDEDPDERPVFAEITVQLEDILHEVQVELEFLQTRICMNNLS